MQKYAKITRYVLIHAHGSENLKSDAAIFLSCDSQVMGKI